MNAGEIHEQAGWQRAPEELVRLFADVVASVPGVELRKMFGYPCAFVNGHMTAGLYQDKLFLRLSPEDRELLLTQHGAALLEPMAGRPMREYVVVPDSILGRPDALDDWLSKAVAFTSALPPKQAKPKASRRTKVGKSR